MSEIEKLWEAFVAEYPQYIGRSYRIAQEAHTAGYMAGFEAGQRELQKRDPYKRAADLRLGLEEVERLLSPDMTRAPRPRDAQELILAILDADAKGAAPPITGLKTVERIVEDWLRTHGYGGLYNDECGCELGDLAPCCDISGSCEAGYRIEGDGGEFDFLIVPEKSKEEKEEE